jgi:hypothetical protein
MMRGGRQDEGGRMMDDGRKDERIVTMGGGRGVKRIDSVRDLDVYKLAFETAMELFEITKKFPKEEQYSLTDQIRRSSRSVLYKSCRRVA